MRRLVLLICLLVLFSGERAYAQRTGPGLFLGAGPCSDVSGQVTNQTYCMDYSTGALYVWSGSAWAPISGNGVLNQAGPTALSIANTSAATGNTQAYFQAQSNAGYLFMGVRGTGYNLTDVPAGYGFVETSAGTNGLYLNSDGGGIYFAANNNLPVGSMLLAEDTSGDFSWYPPGGGEFYVSGSRNSSLDVFVDNASTGTSAQGGFFVINANGIIGGFSAIGSNGTAFGAPYQANQPYLNGDTAAGLLVYGGGGALHLAASGQPNTLDLTSDGTNFFFADTNGGGVTRFTGGNPTMQLISTTNSIADILQIYPQNITIGVAIYYNGIHMVGSNGNNPMFLDSEGNNTYIGLQHNVVNGDVYLQNNAHLHAQLGGGSSPTNAGCGSAPSFIGGSTDTAGGMNLGGPTNNCIINFGNGYPVAPICQCTLHGYTPGALVPCSANSNTSSLTMVFPLASGTYVTWQCIGN